MRRLRFLLKPGWVALFLVVIGFAYLAFSVLAPWQLGKNSDVQHRNHAITEASGKPATGWEDLIDAQGQLKADAEWRTISLTGEFAATADIVLRNRAVSNTPGFEILTPFTTVDGHTILINRGFVALADGAQVPAFAAAPGGTVRIEARMRNTERAQTDIVPIGQDRAPSVTAINTASIGRELSTPLVTPFAELREGQPGALVPIPLPALESGPYLSYGLQWIAFGIMAPLAVAYFIAAELKARRAETGLAGAGSAVGGGADAGAAESVRTTPGLGQTAADRRHTAAKPNPAAAPAAGPAKVTAGMAEDNAGPSSAEDPADAEEQRRARKLAARYGSTDSEGHRSWALSRIAKSSQK